MKYPSTAILIYDIVGARIDLDSAEKTDENKQRTSPITAKNIS